MEKKDLYSLRALMRRNPDMRRVLVGLYLLTSSSEENAVSIKALSEWIGVPYKKTRRCLRTLWRRDLAVLRHGLWYNDRPAGSGYGITVWGEHAVDCVLDLVQKEMEELSARLV